MVSKDESLSQSNDLYKFLCPSPDSYNERKRDQLANRSSNDEKFFLKSLFKRYYKNFLKIDQYFINHLSKKLFLLNTSSKPKQMTEDEFLDELFTEQDSKNLDINDRDSIAEPFYHLIEELFELKSMKKIFRKSLILFVQLTYGATINRQIRQSIYSLFNDEMVSFYLKQIKDSIWTVNIENNETELIKHEDKSRRNEDKILSKKIAKQKLIASVPGFRTNLNLFHINRIYIT